jgi:hypothetical protein
LTPTIHPEHAVVCLQLIHRHIEQLKQRLDDFEG